MNEIKRWAPDLKAIAYHGVVQERNRLKAEIGKTPFDVCVTTYEQFVSEKQWFKNRFRWQYVVLDEGYLQKKRSLSGFCFLTNNH